MNWLLPASLVTLLITLAVTRKKTSNSTGPDRWVSVVSEDGKLLPYPWRAHWISTAEQTALFGPQFPTFYTQDEGGLFMFLKAGATPDPTDATQWLFHKPSYTVEVLSS